MGEHRPGPVIVINGYPGVGKYTIAKRLTELFTHIMLVHDKLFTNLADALVPRDTEDYSKVWGNLVETSFLPIQYSDETFDLGYIFTEFLPNDEEGRASMTEYIREAAIPDDRQREFITFTLICEEQENVRRLISPERQQSEKLTDPEVLRNDRTNDCRHDYLGDCHHVIDVTNLEVDAAALAIARRLGLQLG
ncbi:hypothetical protein NW752_008256 [Fusarium irregulare]|uniref:Uncharacterized protein n=1 Tax=Fusarium irregulare TaxID=2494466 RepID=A0A9W8PVV0_9HYPO|nr:hypothetical protein NW752_008256 [Fusarium irregulare]KAJ4019491.1 hypothetical protein NW766_003223 [Fusarium irregulare]